MNKLVTKTVFRSLGWNSNPCAKLGGVFASILVLAILLAAPAALHAQATATLKAADASGVSAFTNNAPGTNWTYTGTVGATYTNYFSGAFGMRSPADGNSYTFSGASLTLQPPTSTGYSFIEKASANATFTINNFTNNGGIIRSGGGRVLKLTIAGNQFVITANSAIWADQNGWIINSPLSGSGDVTNRSDGNANDTIAYGGNNSAWTGRMRVASTAGTAVMILNNVNATPGNPASATPDQITLGGTTGCLLVDNAGVNINNANGGVTLAVATTITNSSGITTVITEPITGAFALTKTGAGNLTLGGNNTYTGGTTISSGIVTVQSNNGLGTNGTVNEATGNRNAGIQLQGNISIPAAVNFITSNDGIGTVPYAIDNVSGNNTINGTLTLTSGGGNTIVQSDSGALTLAGTNIPALNIGARTLILQGVSTAANKVSGPLLNNTGTSDFLSVTKAGTGTWTLSGTNTYTGNTAINAGTLALSGNGSISNSANISIASGAIFDVSGLSSTFTLSSGQTISNSTGTVNGSVATTAGSVISSDTAGTVGTLTFNNNLNLSLGNTTYFGVWTVYNSGNDQIVVGGNLTLSSSDTIHINALNGAAPLDQTGDYILFAVSGTTTMSTTPALVWDGTPPSNSGNYSIKKSGNNVVLRYSAGTPPTVTAIVSPDPSVRNQALTITANVTQGTASIASVKVDLTAIGGSSSASLIQDSSQLPSLVYTNTFTEAASTSAGNPTLTVTVTDTSSPTPLNGIFSVILTVNASSLTWNGNGANNNWSNGTNWINGLAPGYIGDNLTFAGTTRLTPSMDAIYSVTGVNFDATAGAFTLASASNTLTNTGGILNNSAFAQTVSLPLVLNGAQTFNASSGNLILNSNINNGGAVLTIDGAADTGVAGSISGGGGLTKIGNGTLTLTASNSFTGNLFGKAGTVVLDSGKINTGGSYCSIGLNTGDNATFTLKNTGTFTNTSDFNVGDLADSVGTLNLQDSAVLNVNAFFIGSANAAGSTASGTVNQTGGTLIENNGGIGFFAIGGRTSASGVGVYNMSGGTLTAAAGIRVGGYGIGTMSISGSAVVTAAGGFNTARIAGSTGTLNLDGGTVTTLNLASSTGVNATNNFNGSIVKPTTNNATWISNITQCNVRNGGAIFDTAGFSVTVPQPLQHSVITGDNATDGGLTKNGNGTLLLNGTNTYTGATLVNAGVLGGSGVIGGTLTLNNTATLAPGNGGIGTLTVNGNLTLNAGSTNTFEVNGSTPTNDLVVAGANVTYGGVLNIVTNGTFALNQQFVLFSGNGATNTGNFATITGSPGAGMIFSFTNGVLSVISAGPGGSNTLTNNFNGTTLQLSWGAGWKLQMQTNSLSTGLGTNWVYVTDGSTSSTNITVDATKPTVFYRLTYP